MTTCPHTNKQCHCQPQEGIECPHGPTPQDYPNEAREREALELFQAWAKGVEWWDFDPNTGNAVARRSARTMAFAAFKAGRASLEATSSAPIGDEGRAVAVSGEVKMLRDEILARAQEYADCLACARYASGGSVYDDLRDKVDRLAALAQEQPRQPIPESAPATAEPAQAVYVVMGGAQFEAEQKAAQEQPVAELWLAGPSDALKLSLSFLRPIGDWFRNGIQLYAEARAPISDERTPADFALEHAEYLAVRAEQLLKAINAEDELRLRREESDDVDDDEVYDAGCTRGELATAVRASIYEFRQRRDRAVASASQAKP